jgi:hypothetical protein
MVEVCVMGRFRWVGLLLVVVCAVGVGVAALASAAVVQLPSEATARTWKGKQIGAKSQFLALGGSTVECTKAPAEGTEEPGGKPLGLFHIKFEGCTGTILGIKATCTGLGEVSGVILVLGTWHLWYDVLGASLNTATVLLLNPVHVECAGGLALVLLTGSLACLDKEPTIKKLSHTLSCEQEGTSGDPRDKVFWTESGVETKASFLSSTNGGTAESAVLVGEFEVTATKETFADNV